MRSIVGFIVLTVALAATLTLALGQDTIHGSLFKLDPFALESKLSQAAVFAHYDSANGHQLGKDSDKNCAMCSLGLGVLEQYAQTHSLSLATAANNWCAFATSDFPTLTGLCQLFISGSIAKLQADFANGVSPDVSCRTTLTSCSSASTCTLFQQWPVPSHSKRQRVGVPEDVDQDPTHRHYAETLAKLINVQAVDEEKVIEKLNELSQSGAMSAELKKKLGNLKGKWLPVPIPDSDGDLYGATFTYRGIQYRGQDCNDQDATVYPGKSVGADADAKVDSNCNGIYGVDPNSQIPWEDALCSQYPSRGILAIGDSATAHFSLPPSFVTPEGFNMSTYHGLIQDLFTEIDWPHCSWSTAWANSTVCPYSPLEITSVYQKMLERNRCMHRDYVNAGVNGASVNNIIDDGPIVPSNYTGALQALPSRYKVDGPSTVFFSMIGNDICHAKELGGWTPLDVFNQKVLEEFAYLDTILAPKSHVIIMGVVDGRVLFDTLKDKHHPIGPTYTQFYDYLNCLKMSPCWGWMNSNQTVRDASSQRAADYNAVYGEIIATATFQNFDLHYFYPDYAAIIAKWTAQGGDPAQLIEPVDGFHPSQTGNILIAEAMWEFITQNVPDAMGLENPNNAEIIAQFGNQGGYGL